MSVVTKGTVSPVATVQKHAVTVEALAAFITAIVNGQPIGKIFPAKIGEMDFTQEQRDQIKAARGQRKDWCKGQKSRVLKELRSKKFETDRITERPGRLSVSAKNTSFKPAKKTA